MLVSLNWLKEFVDIDRSVQEVADLLTMSGIEVEVVTSVGCGLDKILTARIDEISPHPRSENLSLVRISLGVRDETVVCGASNIGVGQIVPYAPPGTVLPSGIEITAKTIKGVYSPGMICSEKELGLGENAAGILCLDPKIKEGLFLTMALPFLEDFILDVSITPNRGDCLSVLGIARELAALTGKPWQLPEFSLEEAEENIHDKVRVEVQDADLCPRYVVRMVEGVSIGPSPLEIRLRLTRSGLRPISNVVDATNLILMECGQPLHAFDYGLLEESRIVVRRCDPLETFVTLDGAERVLPENSLMIRDGKRSVALAGIMGGLNSEIGDDTTAVVIESACFERFGIRRTAKSLGMSSEASYRFERGVDPESTLWAAHRAAYLIGKLAGGKVIANCIDVYPKPITRQIVSVRTDKVNGLLGLNLKGEEISENLKRLGVEVKLEAKDNGVLVCRPPSWRWDLEREVDMIEEVARVYGFQNIPVSMPCYLSAPDRTRGSMERMKKANECMNAAGFTEIITMSFVSREAGKAFAIGVEHDLPLELLNPLTEDYTVMRTSLIPGLISTAKRNINFKCENLTLYEMGKTFTPVPGQELPREDLRLAAIAVGKRHSDSWHFQRGEVDIYGKIDPKREVDYYDLKGALEIVLEAFEVNEATFVPSNISFLHQGTSADVVLDGKTIGFLGELAPKKARDLELTEGIQIFEILLEPLFIQRRKKRVFRPIPRYPYIERDLSLMVETNCSGDDIKHLISRLGYDIITSVILFDLYRGETIPECSQSMAFRIRYQSENRTLTDDEVQEVHSSVVDSLVREFGATMRE